MYVSWRKPPSPLPSLLPPPRWNVTAGVCQILISSVRLGAAIAVKATALPRASPASLAVLLLLAPVWGAHTAESRGRRGLPQGPRCSTSRSGESRELSWRQMMNLGSVEFLFLAPFMYRRRVNSSNLLHLFISNWKISRGFSLLCETNSIIALDRGRQRCFISA